MDCYCKNCNYCLFSISLTFLLHTYIYVCMYVCMCVCVCVCVYMCVCVYLCIYVSIYVCMYVSMYVCIYLCMYLCIYLSIYLSIYQRYECKECSKVLSTSDPDVVTQSGFWPGSIKDMSYVFDQDLFLQWDIMQKQMLGVSERSSLKSLELFSKQKRCVCGWIIHSPLPDRVLYANCPILLFIFGLQFF